MLQARLTQRLRSLGMFLCRSRGLARSSGARSAGRMHGPQSGEPNSLASISPSATAETHPELAIHAMGRNLSECERLAVHVCLLAEACVIRWTQSRKHHLMLNCLASSTNGQAVTMSSVQHDPQLGPSTPHVALRQYCNSLQPRRGLGTWPRIL